MHDEGPDAVAAENAGALTSVPRGMPAFWTLLLFYAAYVAAGTLCNGLSLIPGVSIIFWPPAGILIATLLLNPRSSWPWWIAAGCAAELTCNALLWANPLPYAFIYYAGNALEALTAAWLIGKFAPKPFRFETIEQVVAFLALGAGVAPTVSAAVIATADAFRGKHLFSTAWPLVWLGDATGILVAAPLTFVAVQSWRERENIPTARLLEAGSMLGLMLLIGVLSLSGRLPTIYLALPVLLWIGVQFGLNGAAAAVGLLALVTGSFTASGLGQFAAPAADPYFNVIRFHVFLGVCSISALFVGALSQQRKATLAALEAANRELQLRYAEQTEHLVENRRRLSLTTRSAGIGTWEGSVADGRGTWSPETAELVGAQRLEFTAEDWIEIAHPDDRGALADAWRRAVEGGEQYEVEFRAARPAPDGGDRWLITRGVIERDAAGRPTRATGVLLDATELRRTRGELGEQTERMRVITDAMPALISYIDAGRRYRFINVEYERWFGAERGETIGRTIAEVLGADAQATVEPFVRRVLAGERVQFEAHIHYQKAGWKWVEAHYIPDLAGDGTVRGFFGLVIDITERKGLEARSREQLEELESIYASVPVGLAVIDKDLRFVRVNEWLAELNGVSAADHAGRPVREVVPALADQAREIVRKVMETGKPVRDVIIEGEAPGQPSVQRAWKEIWTPVKDESGETIAVSVVVEDVTGSRWAESLISEQNRLFEMIAAGRTLDSVLTELTAVIDRLQPGTRSAVLVADRERSEFEAAYAANIADTYIAQLKGVKIEETPAGTCCEAVYKGLPVTSTDVASDARWTAAWRDLCLSHNIAACHSEPIVGEDGRPLGTVVLGYDTPREPDERGLQLVRLGAQVASVAIERGRAEEALTASEREYRTLFESIDEGYCVVEVICDDQDRPVDYRFLQINPAFTAHTGLPADAVGRTARELVPDLEDRWVEAYGSVALTGEPARFEERSEPMGGRWFDVYALRVGEPAERRVGILFRDITERKARERAVAAAAARDEFRVRLSDRIRGLKDADDVKRAAAGVLGERLGVNRAFYAEVRGDDWMVLKGYELGVDPMRDGRYSANDFGTWIMDIYRAGERVVFNDTQTDPRFSPAERGAHASMDVIGAVGVPLIKAGELVAILAVHTAEPRDWTEEELALIDETAERTWDAVERVRAEGALRLSEERLRLATEAGGIYTWEYDPSTGISRYSPNMRSVLGFELPANTGNANLYVHPLDRDRAMSDLAACLDGQAIRSEYRYVDPATGDDTWVATHGALIPTNGRPSRVVGITQNITERKLAEGRLRASEQENREILESITDAFFGLDSQWRFNHTNRQAEFVLMREPGSLIGKVIWEEFPSLVGSKFEAAYRRAMEEGESSTLTDYYPEHERWYEVHAYPRRAADGSRGVSVYFRNVTERVAAEQAIRESERSFRQLVEASPFGIYAVDADFQLASVSAGAQKVFENVRPLIGRDFAEVLRVVWGEPFATDAIGIFRHTLETGEPYHAPRTIETRGDIGEIEAYDWKVERIAMPDGRPGVVCHFYDLSERIRYEAELRDAELRFRSTFEQAAVGIAQVAPDGRWMLVNDRLCEILGYAREELLGGTFQDITHPDDLQADVGELRRALAGETNQYVTNKRYVRKGGDIVWAHLTVSLVRDADGSPKYFVSVVQDITDQVRAEAALRESEERQAFLLQLSDELGPIADPHEIQLVAGRALGRYLGANRAYYVETEPDGEHVVCSADYTDGVPSAVGRYRLEAFGPTLKRDYRAGKIFVVTDTFADERVPAELREAWASIGIRAQVGVPLVKQGRFVAALGVDQSTPRSWTDHEVTLVREVAERTWAAVERARAEAALRESEERYRFLDALGETTRTAADPATVMAAATRLLGEHLGVARCAYADVEADNDRFTIRDDWRAAGVPTTAGVYSLDLFGTRAAADMRAGRVLVIRDVDAELAPEDGGDTFNAIGIKAIICFPLVKEGRLKAMMAVHNAAPRDWSDEEVALVREATERSWAHIERIAASEALRQSEERYRAVVETQSEMICRFSPDGTIFFSNDAYARSIGTPVENLAGESFWNHIPEEDHAAVRAMLDSLTPEEPVVQIENRFGLDGDVRWTLWTNRALSFDSSGRVTEAQSTGVDISERKRAEEQLAEQKRLYQSITDNATTALFIMDERQQCIFMNPAAEELTGYAFEETSARPLHDVVHHKYPDGRDYPLSECPIDQAFPTRNQMQGEETFVHKDGHFYNVAFTASPLPGPGGATVGTVIEVIDITDRKRAEASLRDSEELLASTFSGVEAAIAISEAIDGGREFRILGVNRACAEWTGIPVEDWVGKRLHEVVPEATADAVTERYRAAVEHGGPVDYEEMVTMPAGDIWALTTVTPLRDEHGTVTRVVATSVNITKRKEAERALQASEERHRGLVNQTVAGIAEVDLTGRFVTANDHYCEITGYTRDELLAMKMQEITHPEDLNANLTRFKRLAADGTSFEIEKRYVRKDGSIVWVHNSVSAICDEQGRPTTIAAVSIDITERKRAEEALRSQTELLRGITESTPDLIYAKDASGRMIMANKATLDVMGQTEETAIGRLDSEMYDPLEADLIMANDRRVMQTGRTETIEETVSTDGEARTYLTTKNPLRDADGRVIGVVGVSHDITALKRAETALRDSETRHRLALESGNMGTWTMPMDGRPCWADEQTLALFDIPVEEWTGDAALIRARRLPEDQEEVNRTLAKAISERSTWRSEFRVRRRDGSVRWLAGVGRIEFGPRGEPVLMRGINFDITERKQAEEELRSYREILEATVRERTRELAEANRELKNENRQRRHVEVERQRLLAQLVAAQEQERRRIAQDLHDHLGQQLTALNLKLELALQSAEGRAAAEHLREAKAMMRQIDDDVDALAWQLRPAILDDDGFLPALRNYVEDWSRRCGVPAELWADEHFEHRNGLSPEAETNLYRITQEALNNVAKYARAGRVEVLLNKRGDSVVLTVQDDGGGFDISAVDGKTMGLIGMRERAGLVGGTFQLESSPGAGTTVYVRVPFTSAADEGSARVTGS